jgi:hypothetical protein
VREGVQFLLIGMPTVFWKTGPEHIKCVFNEKLEYVDDFSFRALFGRIRVVIYKVKYVPSYH